MHISKIIKNIIVLVIVLLNSEPAFGFEKHALLIGIDDYKLLSDISNLEGSGNDVAIMKEVLSDKRFNFDQITVLYNEEATHSLIEKAFKKLAADVKKNNIDLVYIYYSGHGSQTRDLNGDEPQIKNLQGKILHSYDQTWVTYGSRLKEGVVPPEGFKPIDRYDILDDQIGQWLNEIASGCRQVVFVSDSCHSGSVSRRGIADGTRRVPADERQHPLGRMHYAQIIPNNVVCISASKDNQAAKEFTPEGISEKYGIFSWYWVKALRTCCPNDSWSHLFNRVSRIVFQKSPNRQRPQISGAVTMKVFESDFLPPAQTIPIYQIRKNTGQNEVGIAAGRLSGVTAGSIYTLEKKVGQPDEPEIKIIKAEATRSVAVTKGKVNLYDQVVEIKHHYICPPIRLLLKAAHEKDKKGPLEAVRKVITELQPYEITDNEQNCDLIVYLFRPGKTLPSANNALTYPKKEREPPPSHENGNAQIWILDTNGFLYQNNLRHASTPKGMAALAQNLRRLARIRDFMQVSSPGKSSPLEITVTPMIPVLKTKDKDASCVPNDWRTAICSFDQYKKLDPLPISDFLNKNWDLCTIIQFNVKNPTNTTYYLYIVNIGEQAEIKPVFPLIHDSAQVAEIRPGSDNEAMTEYIRLDTKTLDRYKIIISKKPINHHLFCQSGFNLALRGNEKKYQPNPLEKIILNALTGTRRSVSYETNSWYAETITIDMRL